MPRWQWIGLIEETLPVVEAIVLERYGLRLSGHGCIVTPEIEAYVDGYNGIIADHFGATLPGGFLGQAFADAEARLPRTQPINAAAIQGLRAPAGACIGVERCLAVVRFDIAPSGEPLTPTVQYSTDSRLDAVALAAITKLRFPPATDRANGQPRRSFAYPIDFATD